MNARFLLFAVVVAGAGCGEIDESVNPSDVSTAGTALAVISSSGLGDFVDSFDDVNNSPSSNSSAGAACQVGNATVRGTIDDESIDLTGPVTGKSINQISDPKSYGFSFDGGRLTMSWSGDYIELGSQSVAGTIAIEGTQYCLAGATLSVNAPYATVEIGGLAEYVSADECGAAISASLSVCADTD